MNETQEHVLIEDSPIDIKIDPNKKTICLYTHGDQSKHTVANGAYRIIAKRLEKEFNVFYLGKAIKNINSYKVGGVDNYVRLSTLPKEDRAEQDKKNYEILNQIIQKDIKKLPKIDYLLLDAISGNYVQDGTPSVQKKYNEHFNTTSRTFFDYIGDDEKDTAFVQSLIDEYNNTQQFWGSPYAFSQVDKLQSKTIIKELYKRDKPEVIQFVQDPGEYNFLIPQNTVSLVDDTRGIRNYSRLPIAEIQYCVYDKHQDINNEKNMIFMGGIFRANSSRTGDWYKYFQDFKDPDSRFYIPVKKDNAIKKTKGVNSKDVDKVKNEFECYEDVIAHPLFNHGVPITEIQRHHANFKYNIILSCVSELDSHNFRMIQSLALDILPFIAEEYDPDNLQIPAKFRDTLLVTSAQDMQDKIDYYNENNAERLDLLQEMKEYYDIEKWLHDPEPLITDAIKTIIPEYTGDEYTEEGLDEW